MTVLQFLVNLVLYVVGTGALLHAYLAFSPMTRDLVAFLSRDAQIGIFKHRRIYWSVGAVCLAAVSIRAIMGVATPADGGSAADWIWLLLCGLTAAVLSLLYWAMYVPIVMAPPVTHHLVGIEEADAILLPESIVLGIEMGDQVRA